MLYLGEIKGLKRKQITFQVVETKEYCKKNFMTRFGQNVTLRNLITVLKRSNLKWR